MHQLAATYSCEGQTPEQRLDNVVAQFRSMPLIAQREVLADMVRLVSHLPDVHGAAVAAANEKVDQPRESRAAG
jgi:hypothetical protein